MTISALPLEKPVADKNTLLEVLTLNTADQAIATREKRQFGGELLFIKFMNQ